MNYQNNILKMRCREVNSQVDNKILHNMPTPLVKFSLSKAYILGALHDSTECKYTYRICQKSESYVRLIGSAIHKLGYKAWIYKEGKTRNLYIVEFSKKVLEKFNLISTTDLSDYIRGYFDTDGGIPRSFSSRYYIYFAQKNFYDLVQVREYLESLEISCGMIHNPSNKVDPDYFRFYVLSRSYNDFYKKIGSSHPEKFHYLRMKI